jgi:SAM-dependent methyltransferase
LTYNLAEHLDAYRRIADGGLTQWNDLFEPDAWTYDRFQGREFLEHALQQIAPAPGSRVFEYGCGTGPAACFLAARGLEVDAVDLVPDAIAIARRMAAAREVAVDFRVADICTAPPPEVAVYDLVVDNNCLQTVVTDNDRRALYRAVRARLKPSGHYLVSTVLRQPERDDEDGFVYDASSGIYYREISAGSNESIEQVVSIGGRRCLPHRRHLSADALHAELTDNGLTVVDADGGDLICRRDDHDLHRSTNDE